ncbi:hypothetical protein N7491_006258 [Penicillium cf. griseofulvum]|uniref:Uncharacterized protein n=1 Tax=Penicillium cf. griseofulvum TaxID=2972120 RepID=A0A9W9M3E7_9EURO|nr:hypothetical protein N7472_010712 [Penicillium cf. griseofulvum]KAJ5429242.1 hypothetical protein N7491_006258 [Penicillium cf. griseofulvum]KAJ5436957.1 hypothetical protein N7445_007842 [Penicillium cf. griseofulvum]
MFPKLFLSVLFLLALLGSTLAVPSLGITKDASVGDSNVVFNSKCTFLTPPTDAQFLKMIQSAYNEMSISTAVSKKKKPAAMIGLAIGNEVYFSSSAKGQRQIIYESASYSGGDGTFNPQIIERFQEVTNTLNACATQESRQHKNQASCGEIMSTLLWMADHPNEIPRDNNPKVAAYNSKGYLPPCSASGEDDVSWGCAKWTPVMGLNVVQNIATLPDDFPAGICVPLALESCLIVAAPEEGQVQVK